MSGFERGTEITAAGSKIGVLCSSYLNEGIGLVRLEDYAAQQEVGLDIDGVEVRLEVPAWAL